MYKSDVQEHHLIAIYNDTEKGHINTVVSSATPEKDTRILNPADEEALEQAAQNSSLIIIGLENEQDKNIFLARKLKENRMIVSDIIAVILDGSEFDVLNIVSKGFNLCLSLEETKTLPFKTILKQRLGEGTRRLAGFIIEEEYRRFSDALSSAPASVIVFDKEKRIVFVSEHYFRAYPQSASRLLRGLSVYEAFDMMSREEKLSENDPRYEDIRQFWYSLSGDIEFTLDNGVSYRLKAVSLPNDRGTIVTAQNITEYVRQNKELKQALAELKQAKTKG